MNEFMDLMKKLKGTGNVAVCYRCGMSHADRGIVVWTKLVARKACEVTGTEYVPWPDTGRCLNCGSTDSDRGIVAHLRGQVTQYFEAVKAQGQSYG